MTEAAVDFDPHFREFANFLDGVGLPAEWSPYFDSNSNSCRQSENIDPGLRGDDENAEESELACLESRRLISTPFSSWLSSAPTGNRISRDVSEAQDPRAADTQFKATDEHRLKLCKSLDHLLKLIFGLDAIGAQYFFERRVPANPKQSSYTDCADKLSTSDPGPLHNVHRRQKQKQPPRTTHSVDHQWPLLETIGAPTASMAFAT
ncbi:Fungal specific transcription factor domain [Geosmithia morbida]|uniref:Fungal specific transcription factor domain n=1 Tax=Geosmithia morbida TaxID=1094350 RepID=A0A9P4YSI4_9HYPO|nr:Fungal specific transcription factor domain [Geosmithia morbida]KAF4122316.1 Fungal specific transcription factor domain [Geosmithia morbida]